MFEGRQHLYNPDFEIDEVIYEVKGYEDARAICKLAAAKEHGYTIHMIGNTEIKKYIGYVRIRYGVNIQKDYDLFYRPKN
jgi:hypothetical protein